ncbi:MAG TPA: GH25 family lysozyme [Pseudomonadota bacterium]|jgi:lysozyme|nr:GH25 family lysozyme [Pseudomonadota bacterium]
MTRTFLFSLPIALSLIGCGSPIGKDGQEEGTLGSSINLSQEAEYEAQATVCPSTKTYGIDVSYYQGTINWSQVKASGKQFAIVRVSDGTGFMDPKFATNWKGAKAAGVTVGAYQFFRPNQDATAQADLMVNQLASVGFGAGDIPPVIDVEVTGGMSNSTVIARVNTWIARVKSRTGRLPVLYTAPGFWSGLGNPTPTTLPYLWVAHWGVSCPTLPPPWGRLRFWQYSSTGKVSGISGNVDLDLYNGSVSEMRGL